MGEYSIRKHGSLGSGNALIFPGDVTLEVGAQESFRESLIMDLNY